MLHLRIVRNYIVIKCPVKSPFNKILYFWNILNKSVYYIDTSVLLENIPLVKFIKNYIRDPSGLFSIREFIDDVISVFSFYYFIDVFLSI